MSKQSRFRRGKYAGALLAVAALVTVGLTGVARANIGASTFEGGDGNIVVNTPGNTDWLSPPPNFATSLDLPSGQGDNSFTQGTSENDTHVTVGLGSIPNNKADLRRQLIGGEVINGDLYVYLGATRANISGTVNFDFEINQKLQPDLTTAGAKTLNRTVGDLLITYDFAGGANKPTLSVRQWNGTVWGASTPLNSTNSEGDVNRVVIAGEPGDGNYAAFTFAEAAINLSKAIGLPSGSCESFAAFSTHSRSSSAFTSEEKDFIAPKNIAINNCGSITIKKVTDPSPDSTGTSFPFTLTGGPSALNESFSLQDGGSHDTLNVKQGSGYSAVEAVPTGWTLTSFTCDNGSPVTNISVSSGEHVTCTAHDQARANLHFVKVAERDGVQFTYTADAPLSPSTFSLANGDQQDYTNLVPGTYGASEDVPPAGWLLDSATCDNNDSPSAVTLGPGDNVTCTFHNIVARGAVLIHKTAKHAAAPGGVIPVEGVHFTVTNAVNGTNEDVVTNANGDACLANVPVSSLDGDYTATELVPSGYHSAGITKTYTVVAGGCADALPLNFVNIPLTDINVGVHSQIDGGTASVITCVDKDGNVVGSGTTDAHGDGTASAGNLEPGDYVCTVTIDP
jgi:hypothetical protein